MGANDHSLTAVDDNHTMVHTLRFGMLTEEGMPLPEDDITSRLLSLPNIVCKVSLRECGRMDEKG